MKLRFVVCVLLLLLSSSCSSNNNQFRIVCNLDSEYKTSDDQFNLNNIDPEMCTHLLYGIIFINSDTNEVTSTNPQQDITNKGYEKLSALKLQNPLLKVIINLIEEDFRKVNYSFYSAVVANKTSLSNLVNNTVTFLDKFKFDGLSLQSQKWSSGFIDFGGALRQNFPINKYLIIAGIHQSIDMNNDYVRRLSKIFDFVNLLTSEYNLSDLGSNAPELADHHAPLYGRTCHSNKSVDFTVNRWIALGFPPDKMAMGIPFYGYSWILSSNETELSVPPMEHSLLEKRASPMRYNEICQAISNEGWQVFQDPSKKMGPYAISPINSKNMRKWIGYDDPAMAIVKANYIISKKLGGAFVYDISHDDFHNKCGHGFNPMLTAISSTLNNVPNSASINENILFFKVTALILGLIISISS